MISSIVHSSEPVTLVGGGQATRQDLQISLTFAPICVAADGGAALALADGVDLAALIGDFDSVAPADLARVPQDRQHRIAEQTSTDFEKALTRIDAPLVIGVGFLGGRLDHQLAVLHALYAWPDRACLLIGQSEVICVAPPDVELPTAAEEIVSLFPLGPVTGKSDGLVWPVDDIRFDPARRVGTSNRATGPMKLVMDDPNMLLILPRRLTPALVAHFCRPDVARWPVRA